MSNNDEYTAYEISQLEAGLHREPYPVTRHRTQTPNNHSHLYDTTWLCPLPSLLLLYTLEAQQFHHSLYVRWQRYTLESTSLILYHRGFIQQLRPFLYETPVTVTEPIQRLKTKGQKVFVGHRGYLRYEMAHEVLP